MTGLMSRYHHWKLPGYRRWLVKVPHSPFLRVLASFILIESWGFLLHYNSILLPNVLHLPLSLHPFTLSDPFCYHPHLPSLHSQKSILFPLLRKDHASPLQPFLILRLSGSVSCSMNVIYLTRNIYF